MGSFFSYRLQNLRIELLEKMLKDNEARQHDTSMNRINHQWSLKQIEREDFAKTNRMHYLKGRSTSCRDESDRSILPFSSASAASQAFPRGDEVREQ